MCQDMAATEVGAAGAGQEQGRSGGDELGGQIWAGPSVARLTSPLRALGAMGGFSVCLLC